MGLGDFMSIVKKDGIFEKNQENKLKIKIVNKSGNELPKYETLHAAGMDLRANLKENVILKPFERKMIPTGIFIELPIGYEAQVRPRSGLAIKYGISIINCVGTIDADYRGEVCVLLVNLSFNDAFIIHNGDRIAQMVINKQETCEWETVEELSETDRGEGGFSSTGIK